MVRHIKTAFENEKNKNKNKTKQKKNLTTPLSAHRKGYALLSAHQKSHDPSPYSTAPIEMMNGPNIIVVNSLTRLGNSNDNSIIFTLFHPRYKYF